MMKKIYFILLCIAMTSAMAGTSRQIVIVDERMEFLFALSAVILAVVGAAQNSDIWRGIFLAGGLLLVLSSMGSWPIFIYISGCGIIICIMHFYPEVKEMITNLWAPESNDDADDKKK